MKTWQYFVSNSSSCSFIVSVKKDFYNNGYAKVIDDVDAEILCGEGG